jgi:hypothetical protein
MNRACENARWLETLSVAARLGEEMASSEVIVAHYQVCEGAEVQRQLVTGDGNGEYVGSVLLWCTACYAPLALEPVVIPATCKACGQVHEVVT